MKSDEEVLADISQTGQFDQDNWNDVQERLLRRLDHNVKYAFQASDNTENTHNAVTPSLNLSSEEEIISRITSSLSSFSSGAPFTIQRITELLLYPNRHHTKKAKYLRAIDRTLTVTSTTRDYPPADPDGGHLSTEPQGDFPIFSPIPWASASIPNERYPSPPGDTSYPMTNGVHSRSDGSQETITPGEESSPTISTGAPPPPIDAVDIGIVPEEVARAAQEGGPPPRSPQDLNVTSDDKASDDSISMEME